MQTPMSNTPHRSTEPRLTSLPKLVPLSLVACLAIATGCATFDPENRSAQPWNQPTKAEISQHWKFQRWGEKGDSRYP